MVEHQVVALIAAVRFCLFALHGPLDNVGYYRHPLKVEFIGSIPIWVTIFYVAVLYWLGIQPFKLDDAGSIPVRDTIYLDPW